MNYIIGLCLLVAIGGLIYSVWRDRRPRSNRPGRSSGSIPGNLLQAVKGDRALAHRLLEGARLKYPDKSEKWYVEKVIYDIQRDGAGSAFRRR
jgi:hypothetical protein